MRRLLRRFPDNVWRIQSLYYVVTGIWPLVHMPSFELISGPKTDRWLVKTVGAVVGVNGGAIAAAGLRNRITPELTGVAIGTGASLAAIDVYYVSRSRISSVYLLDALVQAILIAGWIVRFRSQQNSLESDVDAA